MGCLVVVVFNILCRDVLYLTSLRPPLPPSLPPSIPPSQGCGPTMARAMVVNAAQLGTYSQAKQFLLRLGTCFPYSASTTHYHFGPITTGTLRNIRQHLLR